MSYYTIITTFMNGDEPLFTDIVKCDSEEEYLDYLIKDDPNFIEEDIFGFIEGIDVISYIDRVAIIDFSKVSPVDYYIDELRKEYNFSGYIAHLTLEQLLKHLKYKYEYSIDNWSTSRLITIPEYRIKIK